MILVYIHKVNEKLVRARASAPARIINFYTKFSDCLGIYLLFILCQGVAGYSIEGIQIFGFDKVNMAF